ncbi:hypothetical protein HWV62_35107 [Athelia sp. TMB]|nr:hypothetical protein HWV62_35107 [Athelia sp. TMB]
MAKTRQTARHSTGGNAPRRELGAGRVVATRAPSIPREDVATLEKAGDNHEAFYLPHSASSDPKTWIPSISKPIFLHAQYSMSKTAHVSNKSTLILHFYLEGIRNASLPPYLVELTLREYLTPSSLRLIAQKYNFTDGIEEHAANVNTWAEAVRYFDNIVIFLTTHAHDDTGDLYGGPDFSADPYEVLKGIFTPGLRKAMKGKHVYLNFLVCGGFADTPGSRMALFKAARRMHATEAIAFSAPGLVPTLTNSFWLEFANRVLVEAAPLRNALPYILSASSTSQFPRHTNLLYNSVLLGAAFPPTASPAAAWGALANLSS